MIMTTRRTLQWLQPITVAALALFVALGVAGQAHAVVDLLSYWNFNNCSTANGSYPGAYNNTVETTEQFGLNSPGGTDTITGASDGIYKLTSTIKAGGVLAGKNGAATQYAVSWGGFGGNALNAVGTTGSGAALAVYSGGSNTGYFTYKLPTTGYKNIVATYGYRSTTTGTLTHK